MSISIVAFALPASALAETKELQAEDMTWAPSSGDRYGPAYTRKDTSNPAVGGYYLWNNTSGNGSVTTTTDQLQEVTVRLRSEQTNKGDFLHPCQGIPQVRVWVDGVQGPIWSVTPATSYSTYTVSPQSLGGVSTGPGTHTIAVKLLNDYDSTTNPCDRNLWIDKVVVVTTPPLFAPSSWRNAKLAPDAPTENKPWLVSGLASQMSGGAWINKTDSFSTPVYVVSAEQPGVNVGQDPRSSNNGAWRKYYGAAETEWTNQMGNVPIPSYAKSSGPTDCTSDGEWTGVNWTVKTCTDGSGAKWSDRSIAIYQPSTDTLWEIYHLVKYQNAWVATDGGRISNVSADPNVKFDVQPFPGGQLHGVAATRIPLLATLPRTNEVLSGVIAHPVPIHLPHVTGPLNSAPATLPALESDGDWMGADGVPEGTRFRLPANIDVATLPGLTPFGRIIAKAAQDYGLIVTDKDCWTADTNPCPKPGLIVEDPQPANVGTDPYATIIPDAGTAMANFPWSSLQVVAATGWHP